MSTGDSEPYLAVLKAAYDYEPQSEDEISIKEDELLFLIERTDDDWWKVKPKGESPDEETTAGLVPAAYVEQAPHTLVKALYDYDPQSSGELKIQEDQILYSFRVPGDDDWLLVQYHDKEDHHEGTRAGYVPTNYVEDTSENPSSSSPPPAAASPAIVVPDSDVGPGPTSRGQPYTDPADLVAASHHTRSASLAVKDPIQTWGIAEVDKKGKKKKGTLGVGNGSLFFASESDKTPVQKYDTSIITNTRIDKSKHVFVTLPVDGEDLELHFNAGSKDTAEAIIAKIESSRVLSQVDALVSSPTAGANGSIERSPAKKGVHFAETGPAIIPPREPSLDGDEDDTEPAGLGLHADGAHEGAILHAGEGAADRVDEEVVGGAEEAVVMYEFDAQGEDELSVREEERVWVIERDAEGDWWKCRNEAGKEGVVPASYVEPTGRSSAPPASINAAVSSIADEGDSDAREADERAEREREEKARKQREQERARATAAAAEAEQKRKLREKERDREKEREERERVAEREAKERKERREKERREQEKKEQGGRPSSSSGSGRPSTERRGPPPADKVRTWHDRTGQFRVDAAFLAYKDGKIRLHKVNGVVIEVPSEKMSMEDMQYIDQAMARKPSNGSPTLVNGSRTSDDDEPLAVRRNSLRVQPKSAETKARELQQKKKKGPTIDWFEFFLNAGCDLDDCTRYATSFERDKIEEELLPDITESTMRSLGLREGDIIRVNKEIQKRFPGAKDKEEPQKDLLGVDGVDTPKRATPSPAPNLFSGPGGALKTARRGRPQPSKSLPPTSVDINAISTASDQIRSVTPSSQAASPGAVSSPVQVPSRSNSTAPSASGFDDDAWTVRPSSTKPTAPTPAAPAAPVAPTPPPAPAAPAAPPAPTPPPAPPVQAQPTGLAKTTEADVFNQLARLSELRVRSPPSASPSPAFAGPNRMGPSPGITSPPPAGYSAGLGMGSSPAPMGQHLQAQQTGILPPPSPANGPRGPYAPVPANQALLQPLIPTSTGFSGFVPTRPGTAPLQQQQTQQQQQFLGPQPTGFQPSLAPQPTGFQPSLAPQPTGFQPSFNSQPTGFQSSLAPQQTGFQQSGQFMPPQQTGMPGGYSSFGGGSAPPVPPLPSFQNNNSFGQMQPTPTGFNPGFGQFGNGVSPPPPQQPSKDTTPANIFASMKAGTFANDSAPQSSDKYDALRANPAPLTAQPTGWGGFPGGYPGYQL